MGTMRIVTAPENTSLNLAQAVMLIAYELYQHYGDTTPLPKVQAKNPCEQPPTSKELDRLYKHMWSVLDNCEFLPRFKPDALFQVIRSFFHRAKPIRREINILMGVFSNINGFMKKYVKNKKPGNKPRAENSKD